ncbi:MAG: PRTRC system protein C [Gammaproteobacteria bacterium]|jgi:PRTRC genetic system protein C
MAITTKQLKRVFNYNGLTLPDLAPGLPVETVKDRWAGTYGEITNASVEGPKQVGDELHYTFVRAVRDKGMG